jgi:hypothetical protein
MSPVLALFLGGFILIAMGYVSRSNATTVKEVPRTARMLGDRDTIDEWRARSISMGLLFRTLGVGLLAVGCIVAIVDLVRG